MQCMVCKKEIKPGALVLPVNQYDRNEHRGADLFKTIGYIHLKENN
jgi:hypothetical protein